jgi:hypothetical protein
VAAEGPAADLEVLRLELEQLAREHGGALIRIRVRPSR